MVERTRGRRRRRRHRRRRVAFEREPHARRAHPPPRRGGARGRRRAVGGRGRRPGGDRPARLDRPRRPSRVYRRPRVAIISTGSELVEVAEKPGPGKIRNSNSYSLAAQVLAAGGIPVRYRHRRPTTWRRRATAFERAAEECDFIVTSGGVSVGDFDFVKPVLEELGELTSARSTMRPGNPQTLGTIDGVPFFGLPGNPTSTYVGFEIFVRPALRLMQGFSAIDRPRTVARLAHDVKKKQDRRYYLRGRVEPRRDGGYVASTAGQPVLGAAHRRAPRQLLHGAARRRRVSSRRHAGRVHPARHGGRHAMSDKGPKEHRPALGRRRSPTR